MALVNLKTNLKSLRYGKDRIGGGDSGQPYITSSPPDSLSDLDRSGGIDFLLRGGTLMPSHTLDDVSRLTKMFIDLKSPNGLLFTAKQNVLSRTAVATQASGALLNEGAYLPTSTILQAGGLATGLHLNKQGLDPFKGLGENGGGLFELFGVTDPLGLPIYSSKVKSNQNKRDNRLVELKDKKISFSKDRPVPLTLLDNIVGIANDTLGIGNQANLVSSSPTEILKYKGGPGSTLGIGKTIIQRYSDTTSYNNEDFKKHYYLLDSSQLANKTSSKDTITISDFRRELLPQQIQGVKKNILSKSLDYSNPLKRIETRVNLGDPGRRNKDVSSYTLGLEEPLDKINAYPLYQSSLVKTEDGLKDLIKFRIGVIDNKTPDQKTYIHFRAFIDSFSDNYSSQWDATKYMGRGEKMYKYSGFDRNISMGWTVAAQSKEELIPMYQKLNYLASTLTPDYSDVGYMRGNLVTLTVGDYLYEQPGIITGINYSIPQESPWEIGIDDEGEDNNTKQLSHIIKVTGFNFIPIHKFVPRIQENTFKEKENKGDIKTLGTQRYINPRMTGTVYIGEGEFKEDTILN